jgi:3-isopropylmalate/(R)-2-methylmalate dehydratase large subunit
MRERDGTCLLYVDRHIVHEVGSPQAFDRLRRAGLRVRAPEKTLLVVDHNVPTSSRAEPNPDPESAAQKWHIATPSLCGGMSAASGSGNATAKEGFGF